MPFFLCTDIAIVVFDFWYHQHTIISEIFSVKSAFHMSEWKRKTTCSLRSRIIWYPQIDWCSLQELIQVVKSKLCPNANIKLASYWSLSNYDISKIVLEVVQISWDSNISMFTKNRNDLIYLTSDHVNRGLFFRELKLSLDSLKSHSLSSFIRSLLSIHCECIHGLHKCITKTKYAESTLQNLLILYMEICEE